MPHTPASPHPRTSCTSPCRSAIYISIAIALRDRDRFDLALILSTGVLPRDHSRDAVSTDTCTCVASYPT